MADDRYIQETDGAVGGHDAGQKVVCPENRYIITYDGPRRELDRDYAKMLSDAGFAPKDYVEAGGITIVIGSYKGKEGELERLVLSSGTSKKPVVEKDKAVSLVGGRCEHK